MLIGVTGTVVVVDAVGRSEALMMAVVRIGSMISLDATSIFVLLHIIGFSVFGVFGWLLLRWIGNRYREKRISDQSITLDSLWLLFGVAQSFTLVFEGWAWIFTGFAAVAGYKAAVRAGFKLIYSTGGRKETFKRNLLLLRVFSLGHRSQLLFDILSRVWLHSGSISLVAGPDLATSTVEPHEFLDFMGGRLSRQFIQDETDLEYRISHMDLMPDPDGRHRVNEFFCRADTWQTTMNRLAQGSDAVLMDLRSFSGGNHGCIFELGQLINTLLVNRWVLLIDDTTDKLFLETTIRELWQRLDASSPNFGLSKPVVRYFTLGQKNQEKIESLLITLYEARQAAA